MICESNTAFTPPESLLFKRVVTILEQARTQVVRNVNSQMVLAYWKIGREIVEEKQQGAIRAEYGKQVINELSIRLAERYGKGFSVANLRFFRSFYLAYSDHVPQIHYTERDSFEFEPSDDGFNKEIENDTRCVVNSKKGFDPALGWSHYRTLMRLTNKQARSVYETEAIRNNWSIRQLERQINSMYYERLIKNRDNSESTKQAVRRQTPEEPIDIIKDPYVLEFLDLPESHRLLESDLETALISHLQDFLLELSTGFAFIGRQKRITLDGDHFYPDLVFYHIHLKCYLIIDLKTAKLSHRGLGQMQMYVNFYDREVCEADENPTVGLILVTQKNDAVVRYVLGDENEQIFASRYKLQLPSEDELLLEMKRERHRFG